MPDILVNHAPGKATLASLGVDSWPIWTCEVSEFPWRYESRETCLLLEGVVMVTPDDGTPVTIRAGDLVVFPAGMSCHWQVLKPVRKHYKFD